MRPDLAPYLADAFRVVVDRPLGSPHPRFLWRYPLNYGYIPGTLGGDGAPIDAYVLELRPPVREAGGVVVAVVLRTDDVEDKLVLSPSGTTYASEDIEALVRFQERFVQSRILNPRSLSRPSLSPRTAEQRAAGRDAGPRGASGA